MNLFTNTSELKNFDKIIEIYNDISFSEYYQLQKSQKSQNQYKLIKLIHNKLNKKWIKFQNIVLEQVKNNPDIFWQLSYTNDNKLGANILRNMFPEDISYVTNYCINELKGIELEELFNDIPLYIENNIDKLFDGQSYILKNSPDCITLNFLIGINK